MVTACSNSENDPEDQNALNEPNNQNEQTNVNDAQDNEQNNENDNDNNREEDESDLDANISPQYRVSDNWTIVPINDASNEVVLLTIDDAPEHYALEMAETLVKLDAPAIFFVNGHFLETDKEKATLKEIYDMGFAIGNHTYSHSNLADLSEEEQKEEIIRVNDMVEEITGERPKFFRPPFGVYTDYTKQLVTEENMVYMNWTYGYDWEKDYMTKEAIADIMVNAPQLGNGGNLLMHDRKWTAEALHDIVTGLRAKGYEMIDPSLIETID